MSTLNEVMEDFEQAGFPLYTGALHRGESYFGDGRIPCADPSFVEHEIAHAIDFHLEDDLSRRMQLVGWGLEVTQVDTAWGLFDEPRTMQATERECRVFGMEWHIRSQLQERESMDLADWAQNKAEVLHRFMPDWVFPLEHSFDQRIAIRRKLIKQSAEVWNSERLKALWQEVRPQLASYRKTDPTGGVMLPPQVVSQA